MTLRPRGLLASLALLVALWVGPLPEAHATVMVELSRAELVLQSDLVVRVTVGAQESRWNEDQTRIITLTRLSVQQYLKGSGGAELTLRQFGGTVEGLTLTVPGDGHVHTGEHAVLFLRRGSGVVYLAAMSQSAYEVTLSLNQGAGGVAMARRDLHDLSFVRPGAGGAMVPVEAHEEADEPLVQLTESVLSLVRRSR